MVEALTVERARELFAGLLPAPGPVSVVSRFAEGSVTGAYRVEFAGADPAPVVLKIYDAGSLRFAVKEARALRFLTGRGLDVSPRLLAFSRSAGALGGRPCLVCSLRPGRTLADFGAELTGAQRHEVYRQLGAVLKRLHAIPADAYGDVNGQIRDPLPDNSAHMARLLERDLRQRGLHARRRDENGRAVLRLRRLRTRTAARPMAPGLALAPAALPHRARS